MLDQIVTMNMMVIIIVVMIRSRFLVSKILLTVYTVHVILKEKRKTIIILYSGIVLLKQRESIICRPKNNPNAILVLHTTAEWHQLAESK